MKKSGLFMLTLFLASGSIFSQDTIPNFDFEDWTGASVDEPVDWGTANKIHIQFNGAVTKATDSADVYSGNAAIVLNTFQFTSFSNSWPVAGTAVSGGYISSTPPFTFGGIGYTKRPTNLRGYAKYFPQYGIWPPTAPQGTDPETSAAFAYGAGSLAGIAAGDTVGLDISDIRVYLFQKNGSSNDTLGWGQFSPTDTTYTQFIVPIYYDSRYTGNPDTAQIILASSKGGELAPGSKLFVDSIAFDFTPGIGGTGVETFSSESFDLQQNAPNPFSQSTTIKFKTVVNETVLFSIVDVLGQEVYSKKINATSGENAIYYSSTLESGVYFYSVSNGRYKSTKKMTINN